MVTELERMMARILAQAVNDVSRRFESHKMIGKFYALPPWYQPAVEALAAYDQKAQEQKVTY